MGLDVSSHYPPGAPLPPTSLLIAKLWRSGRLSALVDPQGLREALVDKNVYALSWRGDRGQQGAPAATGNVPRAHMARVEAASLSRIRARLHRG